MRNDNEAAFLRSIAEQYDDNVGRLVFADWLDEQGESARAEFVRVQCECDQPPKVSAERWQTLRMRERELLDAHRPLWLSAFGLPIEDVRFERGLIAGVRLSQWDDGALLEPDHAPRFATLTELDLSGLAIGNAGVAKLAKKAQLPALRKLILSGNKITDTGAKALANAAGLPRLATVFLFDNKISAASRKILEGSQNFRLASLDIGQREEGYCMSPGQAEVARRQFVRERLLPVVANYFATYPHLRSAMLCAAQYWADEANDAVHGTLIVSELLEPTLDGVLWGDKDESDPNVPNTHIKGKYQDVGSAISLWEATGGWDDNGAAIPLWAGYAPEGGTQEYSELKEAYAPAVMFYRHGGYEFLPMCRPYLDGIRPESGWEDE